MIFFVKGFRKVLGLLLVLALAGIAAAEDHSHRTGISAQVENVVSLRETTTVNDFGYITTTIRSAVRELGSIPG